jgi:hypothetical protein
MAKTALQKRIEKCGEFSIGDKVIISRPFRDSKDFGLWDSEMKYDIGTESIICDIDLKDGSVRLKDVPSEHVWWSPFSLDVMLSKSKGTKLSPSKVYEKLQAKWIKLNNIKIDSKVKVIRTAGSGENGWNNTWTEDMSKNVNNVLNVDGLTDNGIHMKEHFNYPYFVLEPVNSDSIEVETSAGVVVIHKNGDFTINDRNPAGLQGVGLFTIFNDICMKTALIMNPSFTIAGWTFNKIDCEKISREYENFVK